MAARGVVEIISKTLKEEEEDEAILWRESHRWRGDPAVAHRRSRSSGGGAEEREGAGANEV
jgi:hypothetical protein